MAGTPKWKRVLISGSNFEVNSLTSSISFETIDGYDGQSNTRKDLVFRDPSTGGWERSTLMYTEFVGDAGTPLLNIGNNFASLSVNIPDLGVSASVVGLPLPNTTANIYQNPVLFKNSTYGGFEQTSSLYFEPFLGYYSSQSAVVNDQMRSGSKTETGNPGEIAPFPVYPAIPGADVEFALTFTSSFDFTPTDTTYIKANNGDYMEFRRGIPEGQGITASFALPALFMPNGAAWGGGVEFDVILRHYEAGSTLAPEGNYLDQNVTFDLVDIIKNGTSQFGTVPTTFSAALTGSVTGSFEIDGPIQIGDKFQLRFQRNGTNIFHFGYRTGGGDVGRYEFVFDGATVDTEDPTLVGDFTGSFEGELYNGVSSSLTNITLNDIPGSKGLQRHNGIYFKDINDSPLTTYIGNNETTMSIRLLGMNTAGRASTGTIRPNKSGIQINGINEGLLFSGSTEPGSGTDIELKDSIAEGGTSALGFPGPGKTIIDLELDTNSGLIVDFDSLRLDNGLGGHGLDASFGGAGGKTGKLKIDLITSDASGLAFGDITGQPSDSLSIVSTLPGFGLKFDGGAPNNFSVISIDTDEVVQASAHNINFKTVASNQVLAVGNTIGAGLSAFDIDVLYDNSTGTIPSREGVLGFRLDGKSGFPTTIPRNETFVGDLVISGNFVDVPSTNNVTQLQVEHFETTDQFILLNSGSAGAEPFRYDNGGIIVQTASLDASGNASGSAVFFDGAGNGDTLDLGRPFAPFYRIGWGATYGNVPWNSQNVLNTTTGSNVGDITASNYAALFSTYQGPNQEGTALSPGTDPNSVGLGNTPLFDYGTLNSIGSVYVDTGSDPAGSDSNVYIYGIFE